MTATMTNNIFNTLCAQLHVEPDRKGEVWIDCPSCGKDKKHFSFNERTGHCFACDYSGSLTQIAALLRIQPDKRARPARRADQPQKPRLWQQRPEWHLARYCDALDRVQSWQSYKPLSLESIARWRLGVGTLPSSRCTHRRLIVPVFANGKVVAFHGRAYLPDDTDAKWLTAGGSSKRMLFNADLLRPGATVVVCENFVDAILAMQAASEVVAVAGGGASWQEVWTAQIAASQPKQVLIWLDNDLVGCPNPETYRAFLTDWRIDHPDAIRVPQPNGPKIANALLAVGVKASVYQWPEGTPAKADIGWALIGEQRAA